MTQETQIVHRVVCLDHNGYKASLKVGKLYRVIPDKEAEDHGLIRVIDESGEDYAFASERFHTVRLPSNVENALRAPPTTEATTIKKFLISTAVIFVLSMAIGFLVHGVLLSDDYAHLRGLFRPERDTGNYFLYQLLAHVFFAVGFVWVYVFGIQHKSFLLQGVRFGLAIAVLVTLPTYLMYYAVQPMPGALVVQQVVYESIGVFLMGIVVAWLNS